MESVRFPSKKPQTIKEMIDLLNDQIRILELMNPTSLSGGKEAGVTSPIAGIGSESPNDGRSPTPSSSSSGIHSGDELPDLLISEILANKPQNFSMGQHKLHPGTYLCNKNCGRLLWKGRRVGIREVSQMNHDITCPMAIEHEEWTLNYRQKNQNLEQERRADVPPAIEVRGNLLDSPRSMRRTPICFVSNVGFFRQSRNNHTNIRETKPEDVRPPRRSRHHRRTSNL